MTDLIAYLKASAEKVGDQLELGDVRPGDELRVVTRHTDYVFAILDNRTANLTCLRFDRPHARVKIMGCTFGNSSSIKPDHLFCGGNLEFAYELDGAAKTTAIQAIYWRHEAK
ncbi:MAG: hypothetical protein DMF24_12935 [Verrucomicrobia bacterium]|nr:MAG: hypothetical protein DMF24_12935 [Verrucomicrobiota bacterium]